MVSPKLSAYGKTVGVSGKILKKVLENSDSFGGDS